MMKLIHTDELNNEQKAAVMQLWNQEYPLQLKYETIKYLDHYLSGLPHKQGIGTLLLDQLKDQETALSSWVVDHNIYAMTNGEPYVSPLPFYLKNGFKVLAGQRVASSRLSAAKIFWSA